MMCNAAKTWILSAGSHTFFQGGVPISPPREFTPTTRQLEEFNEG